jgi:hypothetical protein
LAVWKQLVPEIARQRDLGALDTDALTILCVVTYELRQHEQAGEIPARLYGRWIVLARNFGLIGPRVPAASSKLHRIERDPRTNKPISSRAQRAREQARQATVDRIRELFAKVPPTPTPEEKPT